jgi:hypothetical protein
LSLQYFTSLGIQLHAKEDKRHPTFCKDQQNASSTAQKKNTIYSKENKQIVPSSGLASTVPCKG